METARTDLTPDPARMSLHERINKTLMMSQAHGYGLTPMVWGAVPSSGLTPLPLSPLSPFLPSWCLQSLILQSQANLLAHQLNINVQSSTLQGKYLSIFLLSINQIKIA